MRPELVRVSLRSTAMVTGATLLTVALWRLVAADVLRVGRAATGGPAELTGLRFDDTLAGLCALALLGCAGWLVAVTCLAGLEAVVATSARGRGMPATSLPTVPGARLCPSGLRRLLLAGCGLVLVAGLGPPAAADPAGAAGARSTLPGAALRSLALPDRTTGAATPSPDSPRRQVTVVPGDSLWSLARQTLGGRRPTDAQTTAAWHEIYRANRDRIGADPDLILPGTALRIPGPDPTQRKDHS